MADLRDELGRALVGSLGLRSYSEETLRRWLTLAVTALTEADTQAEGLREQVKAAEAVDADLRATAQMILDERNAAILRAEQAELRVTRLESALTEIYEGRGAFSRDPLQHADNCITDMKRIAMSALEAPDAPPATLETGEAHDA